MKFEVKYLNSPNNQVKEIVDSYWEFNNNRFTNDLSYLSEKFDKEIKLIIEIVEYSSVLVMLNERCCRCSKNFEHQVKNRSQFIYIKNRSYNLCVNCNPNLNSIENLKGYDFYLISSEEYALKNKVWEELSPVELKILQLILLHKEKYLIYKYVFKNDIHNQDIWNVVNHLQDLGLIFIDRDENKTIKSFSFKEELVTAIFYD